jgi:hypothetical protein
VLAAPSVGVCWWQYSLEGAVQALAAGQAKLQHYSLMLRAAEY